MFDNRMAEARKRLNLTQKQVAEKAKVQPSTYSSYENDKKIPPLDIALRIADALNVSIGWLCGKEITSIDTYGSVARAIIAAYAALTADEDNKARLYIDNTRNVGQFSVPIDTLTLETTAENLTRFFEKMVQYEKMSLDNKNAHEMYEAWLKGELEKLDKQEIQFNFVYKRE